MNSNLNRQTAYFFLTVIFFSAFWIIYAIISSVHYSIFLSILLAQIIFPLLVTIGIEKVRPKQHNFPKFIATFIICSALFFAIALLVFAMKYELGFFA